MYGCMGLMEEEVRMMKGDKVMKERMREKGKSVTREMKGREKGIGKKWEFMRERGREILEIGERIEERRRK